MERPIFNSRDPAYKVPFGAVSCGRLITFRLYPPGEEAVAAAFLVVHREFAGLREEFPFSAAGDAPAAAVFPRVRKKLLFLWLDCPCFRKNIRPQYKIRHRQIRIRP